MKELIEAAEAYFKSLEQRGGWVMKEQKATLARLRSAVKKAKKEIKPQEDEMF